jgi:hypothetical protein
MQHEKTSEKKQDLNESIRQEVDSILINLHCIENNLKSEADKKAALEKEKEQKNQNS